MKEILAKTKEILTKYLVPTDPNVYRRLLYIKLGASAGGLLGMHLLTRHKRRHVLAYGMTGSLVGGTTAAYFIGFNNLGLVYIPYIGGVTLVGFVFMTIYSHFLVRHRNKKMPKAKIH